MPCFVCCAAPALFTARAADVHEQRKPWVPLMLEEGYRPKGWLGMILGVRLWYGFYGTTLGSEGAFEGKMGELCRELGARGKEG